MTISLKGEKGYMRIKNGEENKEKLKENLIQIILDEIKKLDSIKNIEETDNELKYIIVTENDHRISFYLGNAINNYERTKDWAIIENFIESIKNIINITNKYDKQQDADKIDLTRVYPVIKSTLKELGRKRKYKKANIVFKQLKEAKNLDLLYIENHQNFIRYCTQQDIPENISMKDFKKRAKQNLIDYGWTQHTDERKEGAATFYYFQDLNFPYQAQFIIPELYKKELGDTFFITFPTANHTLVAKIDENVMNDENNIELVIKNLLFLKLNTMRIYNDFSSPLSNSIYQIQNEKLIKID